METATAGGKKSNLHSKCGAEGAYFCKCGALSYKKEWFHRSKITFHLEISGNLRLGFFFFPLCKLEENTVFVGYPK